jgi:hypothetical protein
MVETARNATRVFYELSLAAKCPHRSYERQCCTMAGGHEDTNREMHHVRNVR